MTARESEPDSATITLASGRGGSSASLASAQNRALAAQSAQSGQSNNLQLIGSTGPNGGKPYPDMPKVSATKPLVREIGAPGTAILGGIITSEEYNEDFYWKDGVRIYEQMLRSEGQIAALRSSIELPIRRTTWSIEPGSQDERDIEIASFVETCLFHELRYTTTEGRVLTQKWDDVLRHALMCLWFGFMPFEQVWRLDDGWVKWARFIPLLPRTIWRWWVGEDNELVGVQQWTFKDYGYQFVDIPADKMLLFVHRQEGNNFEGVSLLRQAYQHWWYKQQFYKIEAIAVERNAMNIPVIGLPENFTTNDVSAAQALLGNLRANESAGVTLPPGWSFEYAKNFQKYAMEVQPTIQHHDVLIARSALAQFLNLGSTETGAFALADVQTKTFLESLQAVCEYIEDVFNADAIRRLVDYNFEGVETYPKLKAGKVALTDIKDIATSLAALVNLPTPLIHPDPELEDFLRDQYGLPKAPVGAVQGTNPSASGSGVQPENENDGETSDEGAAGDDGSSDEGSQQSSQDDTGDENEDGGADSPSDDAGGGDGGDSTGMSDGLGEARTELRLLREALAAVAGFDAVERGETFKFAGGGYNPYRDPHGRFAPGPHAVRPGEEEGAGHGGGGAGSNGARGSRGGRGGGGGSRANQNGSAQTRARSPRSSSGGAGNGRSRGTANRQPAETEAERAAGHHQVEEMHAAAVARRTARQAGQTPAEREMVAARLNRAQANHAHEQAIRVADKAQQHRLEAERAQAKAARHLYDVKTRNYEQLKAEALNNLHQTAPDRAARLDQLRNEAAVAHEKVAAAERDAAVHEATRDRIIRESDAMGIRMEQHPDYAAYAAPAIKAFTNRAGVQFKAHQADEKLRHAETNAVRAQVNKAVKAHPEVKAAQKEYDQAAKAHAAAKASHEQTQKEGAKAYQRLQAAQQRVAGAERGLRAEKSPSGVSIVHDEESKAALNKIFGRDLSDHEIAQMTGAQRGDEVRFDTNGPHEVGVNLEGKGREASFTVKREGNAIVHFDASVRNTGEKTAGSGADVIKSFQNLHQLGFTRLKALAARGDVRPGQRHSGKEGYNGYYTWAKLGATGRIPDHVLSSAQAKFGRVTRVEQIMQKPGGVAWWREHGDSFEATFDFHRGSYSMRTLNGYLAKLKAHDDRKGGS